MIDNAQPAQGAASDPSSVTTEGSAKVLNVVKGRLENIEAGELPVIEKIGADGVARRVDPTGEMIRPPAEQIEASRQAAEAFAAAHASTPPPTAPPPRAATGPATSPGTVSSKPSAGDPERKGLWARIMAWFKRG